MKKITMILIFLSTTYISAQEIVNVYSHRHYAVDKKLYKIFKEQTGIKVNLIKASSSELIKRILHEGEYTTADVLLTTDVGMLQLAKSKNIFQSINSKFLNETIPKHLKDENNLWFAMTKRARVIAYNIDKIKKNELSTYKNLTSAKWKKKIVITKSNEVYNQSLLASFIVKDGYENAKKWASGIKNNMARKPKGVDKDSFRAIAAGIGDIAIANTYYLGQLINSKSYSDIATAEVIGVFFPNQAKNESGTHINISGAGLVKYSKNKNNAIKFIEFLASVKAQEKFAEVNFEYPVNKNAKISKLLKSWGSFKEDKTSLYKIGNKNKQAVILFDEVNWNK